MERIVEQQRTPARPGISRACGAENAEAIGSELALAQHHLRRQVLLALDGVLDLLAIA